MLLGTKMKWEVVGDTLYVFAPVLRGEDVLIKEISPGFYQIRPLVAGAVVKTREGERFRVFVYSGVQWVTE